MKNILLVLMPSFIACMGFIGAIVYEIVKKSKYFGFKTAIFAVLIVVLLVLDMPIYKDVIKKDTTTVVAEYVEFQSSNTLPATRKAFFEGATGRFHVYVPTVTRDIAKLEVGKTYEIEYFCNSYIVKEYKLLEY